MSAQRMTYSVVPTDPGAPQFLAVSPTEGQEGDAAEHKCRGPHSPIAIFEGLNAATKMIRPGQKTQP